jgi:hypothetical protein
MERIGRLLFSWGLALMAHSDGLDPRDELHQIAAANRAADPIGVDLQRKYGRDLGRIRVHRPEREIEAKQATVH